MMKIACCFIAMQEASTLRAEGSLLKEGAHNSIQYSVTPAYKNFAYASYLTSEDTITETNLYGSTTVTTNIFDLELNSYEITKQHLFFASPGTNRITTGWRFDGFTSGWRYGLGDEVSALQPVTAEQLEAIQFDPLRDFLRDVKTSVYGSAGLRVLDYEDAYRFLGVGSILGTISVHQEVDHLTIGPQLALGAVAEKSMWRFEAVVMGVVGYQRTKYTQHNYFGSKSIPGGINRSATARTTSNEYHMDEEEFGWHAEARLTGSCQISQHVRFDAMWRYFITGPYYSAYDATLWNAPGITNSGFGIQQPEAGSASQSDLFLGLTYLR